MRPFALRDYQEAGVADIRSAFARVRRVLYVLPTGGGKTVIFTYISEHAAAKGNRVTILAHRREIVDQISAALASTGVGHGRLQPDFPTTDHTVQVGMIQTVARRVEKLPAPNLLVLDEAHHGVAGTWATVTDAWRTAKILGVTATPERLDGRGLREAFDEMVIGPDVRELIDQDFLADFIYLAPKTAIDLTGLQQQMGDYIAAQLASRVDKKTITGDVIAHYEMHLAGRSAIAFCCTVAHAENVAAQFAEAGIAAAPIDGSMIGAEREALVNRLRCGNILVLTSCELVSEGFDVPAISGAILLRPTASFGMFRQQVGRCLRPKPNGSKAIILDHVHNVDRHGLPDALHPWSLDSRPRRPNEMPTPQFRKCRSCDTVFPLDATKAECPTPGHPACLFARVVPTEIGGTLDTISVTPKWAKGINIRDARGRCWFDLLRLADGREDRLKNIQIVRGYKPGWVFHRINESQTGTRA